MPLPFKFDWKEPNYGAVFAHRLARLHQFRKIHAADCKAKDAEAWAGMCGYYKDNPWDFINDWGVTFDPRNVERKLPASIPFILFPRQIEWCKWLLEMWHGQQNALTEKSRDMGLSWLAVSMACTLCLFNDGMSIGFGSRKEEYVDKIGDPKTLFWKARFFLDNVPREFRGSYTFAHMRITFPLTGSDIGGEAGDNIGRGDRRGIYMTDEDAYLEHPELIDASLSQTTNCRISISSVNGMANTFAQKRHGGKIPVFEFDWRADPRKDQKWYDSQVAKIDNPVIVAQEIDRDYTASVDGVVIPGAWVRAAIDAADHLSVPRTGKVGLGYDVADEGIDKNAVVGGQGIFVDEIVEWSGAGSDIHASTQKVFNICERLGVEEFKYDADGLGADVRGAARVINESRKLNNLPHIDAIAYRGSGAVYDPESPAIEPSGDYQGSIRKNIDYFMNGKAQNWWALRRRFQRTFNWRVKGIKCSPDEIISISSKHPLHLKLVTELSQATAKSNGAGKMTVDKKPDGTKSPNLADALVIRYSRAASEPMRINEAAVAAVMTGLMRAGVRHRDD